MSKISHRAISWLPTDLKLFILWKYFKVEIFLRNCQSPTKTSKSWQWQGNVLDYHLISCATQTPHYHRNFEGNLRSWILVCNLILPQLEEINKHKSMLWKSLLFYFRFYFRSMELSNKMLHKRCPRATSSTYIILRHNR